MDHLKKILNVAQTRETDAYTIKNKPISSLELMESAAIAFVNGLVKKEIASKKIIVICGAGNNGGDGFAVCRLLKTQGVAGDEAVKHRSRLFPMPEFSRCIF